MGTRTKLVALLVGVAGLTLPRAVTVAQVPPTGTVPATAVVPQIVTTAMGDARLTPDRASILAGVQTRAATAAAAARDNANRQQAIITAIAALGIPREQISTENYTVYPETRYDREGQSPTVVAYVVSNVVRVELRNLQQVGPVIDAALSKGANQINSLEFSSSNTDAARHRALGAAIGRARADAEVMAQAAGGRLGQLIELVTMDMGPRPVFRADAMMAKAGAAGAPTPIEAGELTVRVGVTARWQFVSSR